MNAWTLAAAMMLLLFTGVARAVEGRWLAPGAYFALIWSLAGVPPCLFESEFISGEAVAVILAFAATSLAGSQLGIWWGRAHERSLLRSNRQSVDGQHRLLWIVAICSLCGILAFGGYVSEADYSIADLGSVETWLNLAIHYSVQRYQGIEVEPLYLRILVGLDYAGALLGGVLLGIGRLPRQRFIAVLPVVISATLTVITTAKAPMLIAVLLCVSGVFAVRVSRGPVVRAAGDWKRGLRLVAVIASLVGLLLGSLILRYGDEGRSNSDLIASSVESYAFGHMAALSAWIEQNGLWTDSVTMGQLTFAGLFDFFGITIRDPGLYRLIDVNDLAGASNVFTAIRGMVSDFTFPGALAICGLVSGLAGVAFFRLSTRPQFSWHAVYLMGYFTLVAWTPIVSIFIYNSLIMAFAIAAAVIWWCRAEIERGLARSMPALAAGSSAT